MTNASGNRAVPKKQTTLSCTSLGGDREAREQQTVGPNQGRTDATPRHRRAGAWKLPIHAQPEGIAGQLGRSLRRRFQPFQPPPAWKRAPLSWVRQETRWAPSSPEPKYFAGRRAGTSKPAVRGYLVACALTKIRPSRAARRNERSTPTAVASQVFRSK